ncbi:MAG: ABC transporter substrate-binding protein [Oscillospiraceae bacterium]|jgi:branched-chain amino acid transport system substrate-binding protein|nr:ABC transporter substrate-binding protein [Oscillospiraceae bacterium]
MRKILLAVLFICFVTGLLIVSASLGGKKAPGTPSSGDQNKNSIYIGVYEPLSGDHALGGSAEALGIRYANTLYPTVELAGVSYEIRLVEADNATDAAAAAKTLTGAGVSAVLGSYGAQATAAGLAEFSKSGIPLLGISCLSEDIAADGDAYFRMCGTDALTGGALANLAGSMALKHAAVLTQVGDDYSKKAGRIFSEAFEKLGGETAEFSFQLGQENFRSLVQEIRESDADFIIMLSGVFEADYFIRQSGEAGLRLPIMGPEAWDSALLLNNLSADYEDVYVTSSFDAGSSGDSVSAEFASRFSDWLSRDKDRVDRNGGNAYTSPASAMAYDAYMLLLEAIGDAGSSKPAAIRTALQSISYKGVTGRFAFGENSGALRKQVFIKTINMAKKQFEVLQTSSIGG